MWIEVSVIVGLSNIPASPVTVHTLNIPGRKYGGVWKRELEKTFATSKDIRGCKIQGLCLGPKMSAMEAAQYSKEPERPAIS